MHLCSAQHIVMQHLWMNSVAEVILCMHAKVVIYMHTQLHLIVLTLHWYVLLLTLLSTTAGAWEEEMLYSTREILQHTTTAAAAAEVRCWCTSFTHGKVRNAFSAWVVLWELSSVTVPENQSCLASLLDMNDIVWMLPSRCFSCSKGCSMMCFVKRVSWAAS